VPVRGRHVMGSMENVFADDSEEESDGWVKGSVIHECLWICVVQIPLES
jgi:hypothetical protein